MLNNEIYFQGEISVARNHGIVNRTLSLFFDNLLMKRQGAGPEIFKNNFQSGADVVIFNDGGNQFLFERSDGHFVVINNDLRGNNAGTWQKSHLRV